MAIVEFEHPDEPQSTVLRSPEAKKRELSYPITDARELAILFKRNQWFTLGRNHGAVDSSDAYFLGVMEVQGQVLSLLGQEHLLNKEVQFNGNPPLFGLKPVTPYMVELLSGSYKLACEVYLEAKPSVKKWLNPAEARIQGRLVELQKQLSILGQEDSLRDIETPLMDAPRLH